MLLHQIKDIKSGRVITNDVVAKDKEEIKYKGYVLEWDETTPPVIKDPKGKIIFTYSSIKSLPTFTGFHAKVDSHLQNNDSKTVDEQISGIKYEDSKTKDGSRPSDDIVAKWKSKAPGNLRNHPMWNPVDYAYFRNKGDSDEQIKIFWERDYKRGKGPVTWDKDSKSTKDQIAELESQKEEAKKMGYGTDAYDAAIKELQKDAGISREKYNQMKRDAENDLVEATRKNDTAGIKEAKDLLEDIEKDWEESVAANKDSADESDVFTQDPLTEKGKEILAAMKKQYGEEKGEQVFYASKNKGTISGVDSYDPTQPRNIAAAKKLSVAQDKAATGDAPAPKEFDYLKDWQNAAMERGYRLQNSLQRGMWIAYQGNREMGTFVRTRGGKLYLDSKTKDDLEEEIKKMAREKADRPFNDDGTIRTPQQAQLAYEQWYKIIKSRYKNDSRYKDSKTKDFKAKRPGWYVVNNNDEPIEGPFNEIKCKQRAKELGMDYVYITDYDLHRSNDSDIIINVVENPNEEVESEEEAFDLVHYNGYNIKLVKETGEYDIYDVGGAMIGHTATLELAKLFVDNKGNATIVYE